ncbi:MAG: hypothetical protein KA191_05050 [Verrucomicrobia bacterium]|jgi:hypothetical protein|nr:hypothetical protein [Verrucomicrobiota bacterium]OQC68068.1 MAG: hypothetical protein BWX48_00234 [Verrucomicrobia bacterium ADurb.Bin006]MDI9379355.1 hypothetical protein [Verrucomicrobiota bacterium]NMD19001.1 type II toxin-antitoxin system VapC family toxin [Verrucomicrobiota bacterium]HOA61034.1 hypothetical protein [Verrucomicrobiota bacterium]
MIGADTTFLAQLELVELPAHATAHEILQREVLQPGVLVTLAPQVLAEFIYKDTDPRRFQKPLPMSEAIAKARFWWNVAEVRQVFPTDDSMRLALDWLQRHHWAESASSIPNSPPRSGPLAFNASSPPTRLTSDCPDDRGTAGPRGARPSDRWFPLVSPALRGGTTNDVFIGWEQARQSRNRRIAAAESR